jgi:cell division protein ZapA
LLYYSPLIDITRGDIAKAKGEKGKGMDNKDSSDPVAGTIRVNIFDQIYSLRSPKGEAHIRQIAQVVDERMRQISAHTTTFELSRIAVLAALNIADELQDLKARREEADAAPAAPADDSKRAEAQAPADGDAGNEEPAQAQTWFEAIFDAEVPVKQRSERLSSQISSRLQTGRQENSKETGTANEVDD